MDNVTPQTLIETLRRERILSARAANCCLRIGLRDVQSLVNYFNQNGGWRSMHGCGGITAQELSALLSSMGLTDTIRFELDGIELSAAIEAAVVKACAELSGAAGHVASLIEPTWPVELVVDAVRQSDSAKQLVSRFENACGELSLADYITLFPYLPRIIGGIYAAMKEIDGMPRARLRMLSAATDYLEANLLPGLIRHVEEALGSERLELLHSHCDEIVAKSMSRRAANMFASIAPTPADVVPYALGKSIPIANPHIKSYGEIARGIEAVRDEILRIATASDSEVRDALTKVYYPFLDREARHFVYHYKQTYGYEPVAFITLKILSDNPSREAQMTAMRIGINGKKPASLETIATKYGFTRERARQLTNVGYMRNWLAGIYSPDERWIAAYASLVKAEVVSSSAPAIARLILNEGIDGDSKFVLRLIALLSGADIFEAYSGKTVAVCRNLVTKVSVVPLMRSIEHYMKMRRTIRRSFPVDVLLEDVQRDIDMDAAATLTRELARKVYYITYDEENKSIVLDPNTVGVANELVDILRAEGRPMHLDRLREELNNRRTVRPKSYSASQVRSYLLGDSRVRALGKSSSYGLAEWDDVFFGTLTDYVYQVLSRSDKPMLLKDLHAEVVKVKPTSANSLSTIMIVDTKNRFVHFANRTWGIAGREYADMPSIGEPRTAYSFEKRMAELQHFVAENHAFPSYSGDKPEEQSLLRWIYNVTTGRISTKAEQIDQLKQFVAENKPPRRNR